MGNTLFCLFVSDTIVYDIPYGMMGKMEHRETGVIFGFISLPGGDKLAFDDNRLPRGEVWNWFGDALRIAVMDSYKNSGVVNQAGVAFLNFVDIDVEMLVLFAFVVRCTVDKIIGNFTRNSNYIVEIQLFTAALSFFSVVFFDMLVTRVNSMLDMQKNPSKYNVLNRFCELIILYHPSYNLCSQN